MAKVNKQKTINDLAALAKTKNVIEGAFDDELWDTTEQEARNKYKALIAQRLEDQLEYLHDQGYTIARLEQLIEEFSLEN
jgi:hypothetical protein